MSHPKKQPEDKEFAKFQRIRLKHIILVVERDSIKEYLNIR